jgi:D-alanine-D-alanine ligase-like ATP-grasp enzyme
MDANDPSASLPTLLYVYHPLSFAPLSITEAASGLCRIVWVVDSSQAEVATTQRLLSRFGAVIDAAGLAIEEVAERAREHAPAGVLSMHDEDLLWTAKLAERLGRPFHSVDCAVRLTDKYAQRQALAQAGLATPACRILPADADLRQIMEICEDFPYPAVLKPRQGQSSRDTLPIKSREQLELTLSDFRARTDVAAEEFVLEGFIPDTQQPLGGEGFAPVVSVETVVENGNVAHACISARTNFRWPFRETGYFTPSALQPALQDEVMQVAGDAALALGVSGACLHTEIKLTDAGPVVIEVNGRPGGGMSEMLERASGFSILRTALRIAVGDPVGLTAPVACSRIGYFLYVFPQTDVEFIDSVEGLAELGELDGVDEINLVRGPGQRIDWREGSEAHVFHLTGTADDHDRLRQVIAATTQLVRIEGHNATDRNCATGQIQVTDIKGVLQHV